MDESVKPLSSFLAKNQPKKDDPRKGWTSASNAEADMLCPGRHLAQVGMPDKPSKDAEFGAAIHSALAKQDPEGLDEDQISIYESCLEIEARLVNEVFDGDLTGVTCHRESRYWVKVPPSGSRNGSFHQHSGQVDTVYRRKNQALILEYKTLTGDIPVSSRNPQLRDQAVLVRGNLMVTDISVAVVQPLDNWSPIICVYNNDTLDQAEREMFDRVRASNDPNSKRAAGPVQCKFCLARDYCRDYAKFASALTPPTIEFSEPVTKWTPEMRGLFLERMNTARTWLDECEEIIRELLSEDPEAVHGWEMEEGRKVQTISDSSGLADRLQHQHQVKPSDLFAIANFSKKDIKALLRRIAERKGKALDRELNKMVEGLTVERQNRPSLKRKDGQ